MGDSQGASRAADQGRSVESVRASLPRAFGRYLLFDHIGRGGMADIYLAQAKTGLGAERRLVVKEILPHLGDDEKFSSMLIEEAKLVAGLRHKNIVQVEDLGRTDGRLFIAMEYVEGFDLNQLLRRLSKQRIGLPAEFALLIIKETLAALDYAHRATGPDGKPLGIVHRDVSPSNVLISLEGEVKLCDFGIAKAFNLESGEQSASEEAGEEGGKVAGKAAYMSPEHARGEELDARADVFAAGILLWELCAGRRLYKGSEAQMLRMAKEAEVPPLPQRGLRCHEELQALLDRALAPDPLDRFTTAAEMLRALDDYLKKARLFASELRFSTFLTDHFEEELVDERREKERAAEAIVGAAHQEAQAGSQAGSQAGPASIEVEVEVGSDTEETLAPPPRDEEPTKKMDALSPERSAAILAEAAAKAAARAAAAPAAPRKSGAHKKSKKSGAHKRGRKSSAGNAKVRPPAAQASHSLPSPTLPEEDPLGDLPDSLPKDRTGLYALIGGALAVAVAVAAYLLTR